MAKSLSNSMVSKMEGVCPQVSELLKALSHPGRLLILIHLTETEKSVSELQTATGLSQSQLSQFLNRMRGEGLVQSRTQGRFRYYSVSDARLARLIVSIHSIYCMKR